MGSLSQAEYAVAAFIQRPLNGHAVSLYKADQMAGLHLLLIMRNKSGEGYECNLDSAERIEPFTVVLTVVVKSNSQPIMVRSAYCAGGRKISS